MFLDSLQAFLPLLGGDAKTAPDRKRAGRIVNISSVAGGTHFPYGTAYCASKHALEAYSACLRVELLPFGIDVTVIGALRAFILLFALSKEGGAVWCEFRFI